MLYRPALSVMVERVFSISAGLDASTVTPGSTAPEESCTRPEMLACAAACAGKRSIAAQTNTSAVINRRMSGLLGGADFRPARTGDGLIGSTPRPRTCANAHVSDVSCVERSYPTTKRLPIVASCRTPLDASVPAGLD